MSAVLGSGRWAASLCCLACHAATAQWSDSADVNLPLGDAAGDQVQAKVAATSDGGCYVSWFDNSTGGYDVRLQRLDAAGNEQWPHNGVLVADRSYSSTQDYGLDVDALDHALLAFRDDRFTGDRITAQRVAPDGSFTWTSNGVQFANGTDFVASPKIAATTDGHVVVGWTNESEVHLQRLDAAGHATWNPVVSFAIASLSDLHGSDGGAVIVSWVHAVTFNSPKHIYAQKVNTKGGPLWGESPVIVFDGGSLQFGNFPPFVTDGSGGAVFSWYDAATLSFQCYAQHVLADGTEHFGHNGAAVSTNATRVRVSPSAAFDPVAGQTYVFWTEETANQDQDGVYGQKFDGAGVRQWTDDGVVVAAVGTSAAISFVRTVLADDSAMVFYIQAIGGFEDDEIHGARLTAGGATVWDPAIVTIAARNTGKSRLAATVTTDGPAVLAWHEGGFGSADVLAQNVNGDGSLGAAIPGDVDGDGTVGINDFLIVLGNWGPCPDPCPPCLGDTNGDCVVGIVDFLTVLGNWSP